MKKSVSLLLIACTILASMLVSCKDTAPATDNTRPPLTDTSNDDTSKDTEKDKEQAVEKSIDIYIIAGQSNGAGYTRYDSSVLAKLWTSYIKGTQSVLYSGRAESTQNVNTPQVSTAANEYRAWVPVRAGMGMSNMHIGAEVGMASYLNEHYYNEENKNKTAGIIKFAHGGTSLLNNKAGENAAGGNWVSPSYAAYLGISHTGLTGGLYRGLLTQIETSLAALQKKGFIDVNIKGVFWMQGESDVGNPSEYKRAFSYFASDLRADIGKIVGKDTSKLAIMVGEISRTSGSASASRVTTNERFITMQRSLAQEIDNVYVIASGQFEINKLDANGKDTNGQDAWHWTTADIFAIGELVGECIVENILKGE